MTQAEIMQEAKAGSYGQQIQRWPPWPRPAYCHKIKCSKSSKWCATTTREAPSSGAGMAVQLSQ